MDPDQAAAVARDVDEALWEETETGLRHQGRITSNYLAPMALGGAAAAAGFLVSPTTQVIAFVAASIIAPGFEALAKLPVVSLGAIVVAVKQATVHRRRPIV